MTLDDLELLSSNFQRISRDFADLGGNRMKIDPYCHASDSIVGDALLRWLP